MPIEPPGKIGETKIVRREENATLKQKKKQVKKDEPERESGKSGKIDIKI
ncbi:MAG TPA: hypothetical protein VEI57_15810 [Nitrospirota bacterium]|nr:hypothetical protein [Nitrospirota bacterium]